MGCHSPRQIIVDLMRLSTPSPYLRYSAPSPKPALTLAPGSLEQQFKARLDQHYWRQQHQRKKKEGDETEHDRSSFGLEKGSLSIPKKGRPPPKLI